MHDGVYRDREKIRSASKAAKCPVCGGDHKCALGDRGLILCGRAEGPVDGFIHMGSAKDSTWHVYRRADDPTVTLRGPRTRMSGRHPGISPPDWQARHDEYRAAFGGMGDELGEALGVPGWALDAVGYGWNPEDQNWTAAERDGTGNVIGIHRRKRDGSKLTEAGSKRGLIIPDGFSDQNGPVLLVEGASDTAALVAAGLCAVGRPSSTGGVDQLIALLKDVPVSREVIVVGENDRKPDRQWPGRDGAERTAKQLSEALGRRVRWALPPTGSKDVRVWLVGRAEAAGWDVAGAELLRHLTTTADDEGDDGPPLSLGEMLDRFPTLRPVAIDGLLRVGETMNVIAASKVGKSWGILDLALSKAMGGNWLGTFAADPGRVLMIDNELHPETLTDRIRKVADKRHIPLANIRDRVSVQNLRGRLKDITQLPALFDRWGIRLGDYSLIVLDAGYRFLPEGMNENANADVSQFYNWIDHLGIHFGAAIVLVHHSSKGDQSLKAVTDVGAGAGSMSRGTDTHVVLRPHEEENVIVMEVALRSFAPVPRRCFRWEYPLWNPAGDLCPELLGNPARKKQEQAAEAKSRRDGTDLLAVIDEFDPKNEGVSVSKLRTRTGWRLDKVWRIIAPLIKDGTLEDIKVTVVKGKGATTEAAGVRRRTRSA